MARNPLGSVWSRWDLHFHTPASYDYSGAGATAEEIVETLIAEGISLVAVTDHHRIDVELIRAMRDAGKDRLTVLPGIELRSEIGSDQVHYIGLFSECLDLKHLWDTLKGSLRLTPQGLEEQGGDEGVFIRIPQAAEIIRDRLGGLISIHAGAKSNSIDRIKNQEQFQRRIKYNVAKEFVDILEIGQLKDIDRYHDIIFPATGLSHPLVIGSDNHDIRKYDTPVRCWIKGEPTFLGLKQTINEPRGRVYLGEEPPHLVHVRQHRSSYIRSVRFDSHADSPLAGAWFDGAEVELNSGLVALIGNQGSGKSAFTDVVGLLGNCPHQDSFSFLHASHFRHPKDNKAKEFKAELVWQNGATTSADLDTDVPAGAVETVRYIPQFHLDAICDELEGGRAGKFDAELRQVIFSRIPKSKRMHAANLDELIELRTADSKTRIATLRNELLDLNATAASLDAKTTEEFRRNLEGRINSLEHQLDVVDAEEPQEPQPPELDPATKEEQEELRAGLDRQHAHVEELEGQLAKAREELADVTSKSGTAELIRAKIEALRVSFGRSREEVTPLANTLGISPDFFRLEIEDAELSAVETSLAKRAKELDDLLDSEADDSLDGQLLKAREEERDLKVSLDRPGQEYQSALEARRRWIVQREAIVGDGDTPGTLEYERAAQAALAKVPAQLAENHDEQIRVALEILNEKFRMLTVYEDLYAPVQEFIDSHATARDRFGLQFDVGLAPATFSGVFLDHINQAKRGSFYGEGGRQTVTEMLSKTDFRKTASAEIFLRGIYNALHTDERETGGGQAVPVAHQLRRDYSVGGLYNFLFGLDYLEPRYNLSWGGRPLEKLSPGQRGSLLLIFYLLVDQGCEPLVIDQPEGNLDNQTVYELLVSCIKEAKERRQIIIVTHNPNLAVVCDAEQVIHCALDKDSRSRITYTPGALEDRDTCKRIIDVLEGTRPAINNRIGKYQLVFE